MNKQVREYIDKYPSDVTDMYNILRKLIFDSVPSEPQQDIPADVLEQVFAESLR